MINDQAAGLGGKIVAGTPRESLYVLDVLYDRDGGKRPEMIVTDTASYSDIVFGLLTPGYTYAPQLVDLPDQKMWRIDRSADYGAFRMRPAAGSTSPGSTGTGRTSCGSSAPSTPAPSAPTT